MRLRDKIALHLAPVPLRIVLGAVFLWAGLGKISEQMPVQGRDAATLANLGVRLKTLAPVEATPPPEAPGEQPPPAEPESAAPADEPPPDQTGDGYSVSLVQARTNFTAADFPEPVRTMRLYSLVLLMHGAAHPGYDDEGNPLEPIWPAWAADSPTVVALAWVAALSEIVFGFFLLIGLLARLGALDLAFVMGVAMWLTQIGPAVQSGDTILGFLPNYAPFDGQAWQTLLLQFALFGAAISLFLLGPGEISIDALAFRSAPEPAEEEEDEESEEDEE